MRILLIDNYDSFTYNLKHAIEKLHVDVDIVLNTEYIEDLKSYSGVILSPGPGLPKDAGFLNKYIEATSGVIPILGVCLGMQAIAEHLGGKLYNQELVKHGVQETVTVSKSVLFTENERLKVGLYHSWAVEESDLFNCTAYSSSGVLMALEKPECKFFGVQFHPESIMTDKGLEILSNFINFCGSNKSDQ